MAYSWQESVKPAGTRDIQCDIEYLDKSCIHVYLDGSETTAFTWTSSTNIRLNSPLSAETVVLLIRKTAREYLYIEFASGAPFIEGNVDTQNTQFLHLAQELVEGRSIEGFYGDINMHRYRITNLGDPVDARDTANKQYVDAGDARLDRRIDAEHAAWVAAVENEASVRKAADDALDVRTTNLEQTYFNANTNSFPWWTVLTADTDTVTPGMPFTKAKVRINGVTQTAGYSYTVNAGVVKFAEVLPAGTLVDMTIGVDTEADTSAVASILGLLSDPTGSTYIGDSSYGTVASALGLFSGKVFFSKLVGDSPADQTALFQSEMNALQDGMIYIAPKGVIRTCQVVIPTRTRMVFQFTGTVFKLPDGFDPIDTDILRFNKLTDSAIYGLHLDGNRDNLARTGSDTTPVYGRVVGLRFGNNSARVHVQNLTLVNMLYCGSQWGRDIQDIFIDGCLYDGIGEHVFYISGKGGGNVSRIRWRNVRGGSLGINSNNSIESHACAFIKSAQSDTSGNPTIGDNDFFEIDGMVAAQDIAPGYASVILINGYLRHATLKTIRVGGNISGILAPLGVCWYVDIDGLDAASDSVGCPLVFQYPNRTLEFRRWTAKNVNLPGAYVQQNVQLFDLWEDCTLSALRTSAAQPSASFAAGKVVRFVRCKFTSATTTSQLQHVNYDFEFEDCVFVGTFTGAIAAVDYIGQLDYTAGRRVRIKGGKIAHAGTYSVGISSALTQLDMEGVRGGFGQVYARAGVGFAYLSMVNCEPAAAGVSPVSSGAISAKRIVGVTPNNGARDWGSYSSTWTLPAGATTIGYDLSNVLVGKVALSRVQVTPVGQLLGATKFWVTASGNTVNVVIDAAATGNIQFNVSVLASTQET